MSNHVFIDGAARVRPKENRGEAAAAAVFYSGNKNILVGCRGLGIRTSLEAEYEALILAIIMGISHDIDRPTIYTDSIITHDHVNGIKSCTIDEVKSLLFTIEILRKEYPFTLVHVDRSKVWEADKLCNTYLDDLNDFNKREVTNDR